MELFVAVIPVIAKTKRPFALGPTRLSDLVCTLRDHHFDHTGFVPKLLLELFGNFSHICIVCFGFHDIDRATAEAAAHHARSQNSRILTGDIDQEIEFLAAHFVPFAESLVRTEHRLFRVLRIRRAGVDSH